MQQHLLCLDDGQHSLLDSASHVGSVAADIEVAPALQQPPQQLAALAQPVLNVDLVRLCEQSVTTSHALLSRERKRASEIHRCTQARQIANLNRKIPLFSTNLKTRCKIVL